MFSEGLLSRRVEPRRGASERHHPAEWTGSGAAEPRCVRGGSRVLREGRRGASPDPGTEDYLTLGSMHNLANVHWSMGEYAESLRHHEELLELRRRFLGSEHPDTMSSLYSVGSLHQMQGDLDRAKPFSSNRSKASGESSGRATSI